MGEFATLLLGVSVFLLMFGLRPGKLGNYGYEYVIAQIVEVKCNLLHSCAVIRTMLTMLQILKQC
jgi:hypothetical protein